MLMSLVIDTQVDEQKKMVFKIILYNRNNNLNIYIIIVTRISKKKFFITHPIIYYVIDQ